MTDTEKRIVYVKTKDGIKPVARFQTVRNGSVSASEKEVYVKKGGEILKYYERKE